MPWGALWLLVPVSVAVALLTAWRFGGWGVLVPLGLFAASLLLAGHHQMWAWWIPFAALTGAWMGIREESGGTSSSDRAWLLLPLLLLAATLPWTAPYEPLLNRATERLFDVSQTVAVYETFGFRGDAARQDAARTVERSKEALPYVLPTMLFLWMAMLVAAGRLLAARGAAVLRWPAMAAPSLRTWRLPDGAIWLVLAGLALLLSPWYEWQPTASTLLINGVLGFCVQGIAVVESLMLARGMSGSLIVLTMVFVLAMAMPAFLFITAAMGISDIWLDYRRLESPPDGDVPQG